MADLITKRNDTYPPIIATLSDAGGIVDLTNANTVEIILQRTTSGAVIVGSCTILNPRTNGQVQYQQVASDFSVADTYNAEFEVTWAAGGVETFPNDTYKTILVVADLESG